MARQKSEDREVSEACRKMGPTRAIERREGNSPDETGEMSEALRGQRGAAPGEGEKAIPVDEAPKQLSLFTGTAEVFAQASVDGGAARSRERAATRAKPKPVIKGKKATDATMNEVTERLSEAFSNVEANRGAPGPDGRTIDVMREHLDEWLPRLEAALLEGSYVPGEIRRVWIPKAGGGQRGLGIPNVIDRVVQESVRLVLEPLYEPTFHASSHGFRPGRSCHTAIAEAVGYVDEGYEWVVDLDLEKFTPPWVPCVIEAGCCGVIA